MSNAIIVLKQTLVMSLYMAVGYLMFRVRLISKNGSASMANLLVYVVLPAVVVLSFQAEYSEDKARELLFSIVVSACLLLIAVVIAHMLFRRHPLDDFGAAFSNAGFMGFPLITALLGKDTVFYAAGFVAILNALQWTYGQYLLSGNREDLSLKKILRNPLVLSFCMGLLLFFCHISLPTVVSSALSSVASMNAPLAMIILGVYLAQLDIGKALRSKQIYLASLVRLVLIPLVSWLVLSLVFSGLPVTMKSALFIAAMAPVGSNVAVYAQKQGSDYSYAVGLVCVSTLLSIITMPLLIMLLTFR